MATTTEKPGIDLIERAVVHVGMTNFLNHGAASCVHSDGCHGVTQQHLVAFAQEIWQTAYEAGREAQSTADFNRYLRTTE